MQINFIKQIAMADLDPIKQVVQIDVKEKGVTEATKDFDNLQTSITETTTANTKGNTEMKKTEEGFKTLKVQLREAIALQQKMSAQYGSTSEQAIKATKAVAGIKDEIGFQKQLVDSYNPDDKFRKLTQTAGIAALALGGVKDGFNALGIESKTLDKIIGSAQAILGVTSAVAGMSDAYNVLVVSKKAKSAADVVEIGTTEALVVAEGGATVAATGATIATSAQAAATWALNAAIAVLASPILLVVAAVALLVGGIGYLTGAFGDFSGEAALAEMNNKRLNKSMDDLEKSAKKSNEQMELSATYAYGMAKANGASSDALRKLSEQLINNEVAEKRLNAVKAQSIFLEARRVAGLEDATDAQKETAKKAYELFKEQNGIYNDSLKERKQLSIQNEIDIAQEQNDAHKKSADEAEKARQAEKEKVRVSRAKELEDLKKFNEDVLRVQGEMNVQKVNQDIQDKVDEKERKETNLEAISASVDIIEETNSKAKEKLKEKEKADDQALVDQKAKNKEDILATGDALIEGAKLLAGKNKSIQKAAIIAEGAVSLGKVGVSIATGVSKDAASGAVASVPMIIKTLATGALSTASIITNTARALKAVGGGGGGDSSSPLPTRNVAQVGFQGSSENQIANAVTKSQKEQPPIQAFVVSQSLTDQQELDRKKELQNSF